MLFVAVFNTHWVSQPNLLHQFFALDSSLFDAAVHMFLFLVGMGLEAIDCLTTVYPSSEEKPPAKQGRGTKFFNHRRGV